MIRRFIRNNALLYPIYVEKILRNYETKFPDQETDLHLTGFPRSGITYCMNILRVAFPKIEISTHIHTTASLKLSKRFAVPTIILLRNPLAT